MAGTVRHYPYTCAVCSRAIESTTSLYVGIDLYGSGMRVCRSAAKCGQPTVRQLIVDQWRAACDAADLYAPTKDGA